MEEKYKKLAPHLKKINDTSVALDEEGRADFVRTVKMYVEGMLLPAMKEKDPLFKKIGGNLYWTGSMYDGLRVKEATEFDINIILLLPKHLDLTLDVGISPAFSTVELPKDWKDLPLDKLCDSNKKYLLPAKILSWLQSLTQRCLNELQNVPIKYKTSGPAITLIMSFQRRGVLCNIDVDLVPVLEFPQEKWPHTVRANVAQYKDQFFLVPKIDPSNEKLWRLGFSQSERKILHKQGCIKMIIRLVKCLRDYQLKSLVSYHIKVTVMWMMEIQPVLNCQEENLGPLFMLALKTLREFTQSGKLPNYWCISHNLWNTMNPENLKNLTGRLNTIIKDIDKDPKNVEQFFK